MRMMRIRMNGLIVKLHNAIHPASRRQVHVWRWPMALAALSVFGLLSALLGQEGVWWVLSWIALVIPVGVILFFSRPRRTVASALRSSDFG